MLHLSGCTIGRFTPVIFGFFTDRAPAIHRDIVLDMAPDYISLSDWGPTLVAVEPPIVAIQHVMRPLQQEMPDQ